MQTNCKRSRARFVGLAGAVAAGLALNVGAVQAQATTETINERLRFNNQSFAIPAGAPGAGQMVTLNGGLHVLLHLTVSESGNCLVKGHVNPQGLSVTFAGQTYRAVGAGNLTVHSRKEGNLTRFHLVTNLGLKSNGGPGERLKLNLKGDAPASCRAIHNLGVEAVEFLRGQQ